MLPSSSLTWMTSQLSKAETVGTATKTVILSAATFTAVYGGLSAFTGWLCTQSQASLLTTSIKTRPIIEKRICAVVSGQRTTGTVASISPTHLAFPAFSLIGREKSGSPVLPIIARRFTSAGTMLKKMPLWHGSRKRLSFIGSLPLKKHSWRHLVFAPTELWHKAIGVELQDGTYR